MKSVEQRVLEKIEREKIERERERDFKILSNGGWLCNHALKQMIKFKEERERILWQEGTRNN